VLGVHLEGPFINPEAAGAHDAAYIRLPSVDDLNALWEASGGGIKLLTLAPEMPGALDLLGAAKRYGIAVAVGHTRADYPQMMEAVDAGASLATHLFNAMGGLTARDPGATGAVLASSEFKASLIADGYHVHPAMMDLAVRTKGVDGLVLVTDAMPPMGTDLTEFTLYGQPITVRDGACFMADGTLAGSMLTMDRAVRNMRDLVDVSVQDALMMASANPAEVIGESKHRGTLEVGKAADIVVMDNSLHVTATIVDGKVVYQAGSA
jgi:N-acetylglucosamine-6-phosphate deacetylase